MNIFYILCCTSQGIKRERAIHGWRRAGFGKCNVNQKQHWFWLRESFKVWKHTSWLQSHERKWRIKVIRQSCAEDGIWNFTAPVKGGFYNFLASFFYADPVGKGSSAKLRHFTSPNHFNCWSFLMGLIFSFYKKCCNYFYSLQNPLAYARNIKTFQLLLHSPPQSENVLFRLNIFFHPLQSALEILQLPVEKSREFI